MKMRSALLLLLLLALESTIALHAQVPASTVECFTIEAQTYHQGISLNYEILRGTADSLETELTAGDSSVVYANTGRSGRYVAPIQAGGLHTVCFKNVVDAVGDIVVGFSFHADDPTHEVLSNADATKISTCIGLLWML